MRKVFVLFLIVLIATITTMNIPTTYAYTPPVSNRTTFNFNLDWKVYSGVPSGSPETVGYSDSSWTTVSTPHTVNADLAFKVLPETMDDSNYICWYRKHFKIPSEYNGRKIFLEFEGIRQAGEFYLNGTWIARHETGVTPIGLDITDYVNFGTTDNVLAVKINYSYDYAEVATGTKFDWNYYGFNCAYGGIHHNVNLHITDKAHVTLPLYRWLQTKGVYIYGTNYNISGNSVTVNVKAEVKNEYTSSKSFSIETNVVDRAGNVCLTLNSGTQAISAGGTYEFSVSGIMSNVKFWNWKYGYLYDVYTTLKEGTTVLDVALNRTGFRKTAFSNGVLINDIPIFLMGCAQRTTNEWPAIGDAYPPWMSDLTHKQAVDGNNKVFRWMHTPPTNQDVVSCDRQGLIQTYPFPNKEFWSDAERQVGTTGRPWEMRKEATRDAIIYNRNSPSIIFWEVGNSSVGTTCMNDIKTIRDTYDPYGGRFFGCRDMQSDASAEFGGPMGEGLGTTVTSSTKPVFTFEYARQEGERRWWDQYSPPTYHVSGDGAGVGPEYNLNQDAFAKDVCVPYHKYYWDKRPGTGSAVQSGGWHIVYSDTNTHCRGEENYRRSGKVDAMRIEKDGYYANKVMWEGYLYAGNRSVYLCGHWTYPAGTTKNVYVISNCDKVKLFRNGVDLGYGTQSNKFLFTFSNVSFAAGELKAVGYDGADVEKASDVRNTVGAPNKIKLTYQTGPTGFRANGADYALVTAEIVDVNGNRHPTDERNITFSVTGPAVYRGGVAVSVGTTGVNTNYILESSLPAHCGITRVSVKSTRSSGTVTVTASASGLTGASVSFPANAVTNTDGLCSEMPAYDLYTPLPMILDPPPPTPTPSATPIPGKLVITSATASSVQAGNEIAYAIDGDTATRWAAVDGTYPQWLRLDLGSVKTVNKVRNTFYNWSSRYYTYNVQASSDGTNYTTVVSSKNSNQGVEWMEDTFTAASARYIRINLTACSANPGYASICESEVYNSGGNTPTPTPTATPTPTPGPGTLLSQGKTASASSEETSKGNTAVKANDGDTTTTRWAASVSTYPQWWKVDLGASYSLTRVESYWYNSATNPRSYKYRIEVSADNSTFTTVVDKTGNTTQDFTSDSFSATGRYVRVTVTGNSGTGWASAWEFKVFGN